MVLPSAYEGYGIVYVEAQQFGLPVIGTTGGAAHEIISDGYNGFLVAPEDGGAVAAHLLNLHCNRQHLLELSLHALDAYARHPRWDDSCEIIRQFLLTQLEGSSDQS
jgi:glycosyltransferase involved in cell wall biosynthesis